jgi:hypothetical protein
MSWTFSHRPHKHKDHTGANSQEGQLAGIPCPGSLSLAWFRYLGLPGQPTDDIGDEGPGGLVNYLWVVAPCESLKVLNKLLPRSGSRQLAVEPCKLQRTL